MPVSSRIASRSVTRAPGRREVELARVADRRGRRARRLLEPAHGVAVVGVGLVPLDHRELGVVLGREALVAEVLADLVDALEPADDAALEVQLGRDPQVHVLVERVVVGHERAGQRAAVERLQHRGLDLDEAAVVEVAAHRGDDPRARDEQLARLLVGHQVELAAAEAGLDVGAGRGTSRAAGAATWPAPRSPRPQRQLAARVRKATPSAPIEVAEVERRAAAPSAPRRARRRGPAAGCARSGRPGRGTPSCPGRGGRRGGRRRGSASSVSSPVAEVGVRARGRRRSATTPGKACGNGSMPAARSRSSFARRDASSVARLVGARHGPRA